MNNNNQSLGSLPMYERNQEATVYVGNLESKVTEEILWELFVQCGQLINVHIPKDPITNEHQGFGFVEYRTEEDSDYAIKILHMIKLYGKPVKVSKASSDKRTQEVGANIFIGNLDSDVDEKMLYDTFSAFGVILSTKITRDPETGISKNYGFVSFDSFESSDAAVQAMDNQYFCNRVIRTVYSYKKDSRNEKHGSTAERLLAANKPLNSLINRQYVGASSVSMPPNMPSLPQLNQI